MKKLNFIKTLCFIIICFCCFSAKTSHAQLSPGDIAIIGVNGDTRLSPTTPFTGTIALVTLVDIPSGTVVKITDYTYNGTVFGASSSDGLLTWTISQAIPVGTVFSISFTNNTLAAPVIQPSTYGSVTKVGWTNAGIRPISNVSGDSWLVYTTNPDNSFNFLYGFLNTNYSNPPIGGTDTSTGWATAGTTPANQTSVLPTQLIGTNAYNTLVTYSGGPDLSRHFNSYSSVFSGTKEQLLNNIKTPANWTSTNTETDAKDLSPGTGGGAFPGTQPIYTITEGPTVTGVTSSANGTKKIGDLIPIVINFSETVNVVTAGGTPRLKLNSGASAYANYASGTGTTALTFNYTVAAGESSADLDYATANALTLENGTIKSVTNLDGILTLPAPGATNSLGANRNIVVDGIAPSVTSVVPVSANGRYRAGQNIDIRVNFSEAVSVTGTPTILLNNTGTASYISGAETSSLVFRYTVGADQSIADLDYASINALSLAGGTITDAALNNAGLSLPTPGATGSLGANANFIIDTTVPTVTSISGISATFNIGSTVPITLNFSEPINVTGTPQLALNVSPAGFANYTSGSGTAALTFNYIVAAGQSSADLDYISTTSLSLNAGSLTDLAGNNLTLTLPAPGATGSLGDLSNIVINGIAPTVSSIVRTGGATALTNASSLSFTMTFSESVTGVSIGDFSLTSTGSLVSPGVLSVTGSGTTYTILVSTGSANGTGTLRLDLNSAGTGITAASGNAISGGYTSGETYTVDRIIPTIPTVTIASNNANTQIAKPGDVITLSFTASEALNLPVVTISGNPATVTNPSGNDWVATYTMLSTNNNGVIPFNITYTDLAGNTGLPKTTTTNSSTVTYDKTVPTLTSVTISANNGSYPAYAKVGSMVTLVFTVSEAISSPTVTIGAATVTALPMGGNNWMAIYSIPSSMAEGEVPFTINYKDPYGNVGTTVTTVSTGSMVILDKTTPTLSNVSISSNNPNPALAKSGDVVTVTFTASEGIASPTVTLYSGTAANVSAQANNVWTATYTLGPVNNEGLIPFQISYSDFAGNAGIAVSTTNDASSVTYDRTLPVAPNFLGVTAGDTQNTMLWFLNSDYAKYELIGGATGALGNNVLTTILAANATNPMTFTQTGLTNFQTYYYALRVTDAAGNVNTSYTATGTPLNSQTITFTQPEPAEYGSSFTINATSSSGLPVTFTSNEPALATISGNTVTIVGANSLQSVSIIATQPGNANYSYAPPVIRLLQINPKPVTVTATAQSKVFGDSDPTIAAPTISPALVGTDVSTGSLSRVAGEDAGTYQIQQNTFNLDQYKYAITYVPANFSITKKPVTITPQAAYSKIYGGVDPAFAYTFTPLVSPDVITGELARAAGENAGTYNFDLGTLSAGTNYNLTLNPVPQFTIDKSVITVTPLTASIEYGDTEPTLNYNHSPALKTGDTFTGALARAAGTAPNNYLINQGTLALSNNYTLNFSPVPVNFVVLKKNISITPTAGQGKVYGDTDGTINYTASPALLDGDTFSGALNRTVGTDVNNYAIGIGTLAASNPQHYNLQLATENYAITKKPITIIATAVSQVYGDADPVSLPYTLSATLPNGDVFSGKLGRAPGVDVGTYPINIGNLALSTNYDLAFTPADLTITPKAIAITAVNDAKTYGDADPIFTYTASSALVTGDTFTGKLGRTAGEDVGSYPLTLGNLALSSNYALTLNSGAALTINKKGINVIAEAKSKVYGSNDPLLTYTSNPALVTGDNFSGALGRVAGEHVGTYVIGQGGLTLSSNYTLNYTPANLTITAKPIAIQIAAKSKTYGATDPQLTYTASPLLQSGDVFTGALSRVSGENKGTYLISQGSLAASTDYTLSFTNANLVIDAAPLTITADPKTKFVGTANPVFTGQYVGFVNGENQSVLSSPATFTSAATINSPIGTYPIVTSGAAAANYQITQVNGVLTVVAGAPTNVLFAGNTLYENQPSGTKAGALSSTSDDPNATFTYSLVAGTGDTDNASFQVTGDQLFTAASLNYENKKVYSVRLRSTTQHGFSLDKTFNINLTDVNEIPTLDAIANKTICYTTAGQTIDLTGISAGPDAGQNTTLTVTGTNAALLQSLTVAPGTADKGTISYRLKSGASGTSTITVTVKDNGGTDNGGVDTYSRTFVLTVNALPVISINASTGNNNNGNSTDISRGQSVVLTASGGSSYAWAMHNSIISGQTSASLTVRPRETTTYTVTVTNANGCSEQKNFTVNVLDDLMTIKATNILSPNGDGYNDKWVIDNIDFYPNNEVKIFDKAGRMVYGKKSYDNSWDGMLNGMPLTEGTYYYVIDFGKDRPRFKGFITIVREN